MEKKVFGDISEKMGGIKQSLEEVLSLIEANRGSPKSRVNVSTALSCIKQAIEQHSKLSLSADAVSSDCSVSSSSVSSVSSDEAVVSVPEFEPVEMAKKKGK